MSQDRPAGALNTFATPTRNLLLSPLSTLDLCHELIARIAGGNAIVRDSDLVVASQLQDLLDRSLDVHLNRFSRRRLIDTTHAVFARYPPDSFVDATVVDLGCGSLNPFSFAFLFLLLGAKRAYAVDLEPIQDPARAARALVQVAGWLLSDSRGLIGRKADVARASEALQAFDLKRLSNGDVAGVPADRLQYLQQDIETLTLEDGEADLVSSVSLLEHVSDIDSTLASLRRVTSRGGRGHHVVDFVDHRLYGGEVTHPLAFLTVESDDALVHGSNRLRLSQLRQAFERHGFTVERVEQCRTDPVSEDDRRTFVEPFRSMALDDLSMTCARVFVRRGTA
jgi:SAM-dependent methyltransferase